MWIGFEQDLDRIWMGSFRNMIEHWIEHYRLHVISCTYHIHITYQIEHYRLHVISCTYHIHITYYILLLGQGITDYMSYYIYHMYYILHLGQSIRQRSAKSVGICRETEHHRRDTDHHRWGAEHHRWDAGSITDCTSCHIHITYYYMQYGTTQIYLSILHTTQCSTAPWRDKLGALSNAANPSGVC